MNLPDVQRAAIAAKMEEFPEVTWDRAAGDQAYGVAYGWIDREDQYKDFMCLHWWTHDGGVLFAYTTSSARLSEEFCRRIDPTIEHRACERVEDEFPQVQQRVRL